MVTAYSSAPYMWRTNTSYVPVREMWYRWSAGGDQYCMAGYVSGELCGFSVHTCSRVASRSAEPVKARVRCLGSGPSCARRHSCGAVRLALRYSRAVSRVCLDQEGVQATGEA